MRTEDECVCVCIMYVGGLRPVRLLILMDFSGFSCLTCLTTLLTLTSMIILLRLHGNTLQPLINKYNSKLNITFYRYFTDALTVDFTDLVMTEHSCCRHLFSST